MLITKVKSLFVFAYIFSLLISGFIYPVKALGTPYVIPDTYINLGIVQDMLILPSGDIWFVDTQGYRIVKMSPSGQTLRTVGRQGSGEGEFDGVIRSITKDNSGNLYVVGDAYIYKFDYNGGFLERWGGWGSNVGELGVATSIYYDNYSDSLYVVDSSGNRVVKYSMDGIEISRFGTFGSGNGEFDSPVGVATDAQGSIYVVDSNNHRLQIFDENGQYVKQVGTLGSGAGEFTFPKDVAIMTNGHIVVTSQNSSYVHIFDADGSFISMFGGNGTNPGQFIGPVYVTTDVSNNIYISDWATISIDKFDQNGSYITSIRNSGKTNSKFTFPSDIAYDSIGNLYVLDDGAYRARLQKLTNAGTYLDTLFDDGTMGTASYHISIDPDDRIFISDSGSVKVFDTDGNSLFTIGSGGSGDGQFSEARDIAFDSLGNIYVADMANHRIQKFDYDGNYVTQWGSRGVANGQFINPTHLVMDDDILYVAENKDDYTGDFYDTTRIQKFDTDGNYIGTVMTFGFDNDGEVFVITGMAKDSADNLYVVDNYYNKIQILDGSDNFVRKIQATGSGFEEFSQPGGLQENPVTGVMTLADSGNHRVYLLNSGVRIYNLINSIDVVRVDDKVSLVNNHVDPLDPEVAAINSLLFFGNFLVSDFNVNLTADRNWQSVNAISLPNESKSLVVNLDPVNAPGVSATHTLYLPKKNGQTFVLVCPDAQSIGDIYQGCSNGYTLSEGDPDVSIVNIEGIDYWKVDNLTGTGIMSHTTVSLNITANKYNVMTSEPITLSVSALDGDDVIDFRYVGTVNFTSTSSTAVLPSSYTFTSSDDGQSDFVNQLIFTEPGDYTVTVADSSESYLTATTLNIHVTNPVPTATPTPLTTISPTQTNIPTKTPTPEVSCIYNPYQSKCQVEVIVSNIRENLIDQNKMQICWDTNIETKGMLEYGDKSTGLYTESTNMEEIYLTNNHCINLIGLENNKAYIYKINATSVAGKITSQEDEFVIGLVENLKEVDANSCIKASENPYSFDSSKNLHLFFETPINSSCLVSYGRSSDDLNNKSNSTIGIKHESIINLLNYDSGSDLYYKVSCEISDPAYKVQSCSYNGFVPKNKLASSLENNNDGDKKSGFVDGLFSSIDNVSSGLSTLAITNILAMIGIATFAYPRWLSYGFYWFSRKNRPNKWGLIYDKEKRSAVIFAVIRVTDYSSGKFIKQVISDMKGRYGLVLDKGKYKLSIQHERYNQYENILSITNDNETVNNDIGLSSQDFNPLIKLMEYIQLSFGKISLILTVLGFTITATAALITPNLINYLIMFIYLVQLTLIYKLMIIKSWGAIYNSKTGETVTGAFVRLFDLNEQRQVDVQITDNRGRYGFIVDHSNYMIRVDAPGYRFPSNQNQHYKVTNIGDQGFIRVTNLENINNDIVIDPQ